MRSDGSHCRVQEFSQLSDYDICHLSSAEDNDIVVGVSRYNEVVIWRYNPMAPHRTMIGHTSSLDPSAGWVEHLLVVRMNSSSGGEHIFTASNDGAVLHWCLDEEQHTDVYVVEVWLQQPRQTPAKA